MERVRGYPFEFYSDIAPVYLFNFFWGGGGIDIICVHMFKIYGINDDLLHELHFDMLHR